jgi:hypothetical protein
MTLYNSEIDFGLIIVIGIIIIVVTIIIIYFLVKNSQDNGSSVKQALVGKGIGSLCTSNDMCGSNKCNNYGICVL